MADTPETVFGLEDMEGVHWSEIIREDLETIGKTNRSFSLATTGYWNKFRFCYLECCFLRQGCNYAPPVYKFHVDDGSHQICQAMTQFKEACKESAYKHLHRLRREQLLTLVVNHFSQHEFVGAVGLTAYGTPMFQINKHSFKIVERHIRSISVRQEWFLDDPDCLAQIWEFCAEFQIK